LKEKKIKNSLSSIKKNGKLNLIKIIEQNLKISLMISLTMLIMTVSLIDIHKLLIFYLI